MSELWDSMGPELWPAFWMTIKLTFFSAIGALIWGTMLAGMKVSPIPVMRGFATIYVNVVRNTPLTLIILFCAMGLSYNLGVQFASTNSTNMFWLSVVGFIVYTATFVCETLRSGFNTVPIGQAEAARSLAALAPIEIANMLTRSPPPTPVAPPPPRPPRPGPAACAPPSRRWPPPPG